LKEENLIAMKHTGIIVQNYKMLVNDLRNCVSFLNTGIPWSENTGDTRWAIVAASSERFSKLVQNIRYLLSPLRVSFPWLVQDNDCKRPCDDDLADDYINIPSRDIMKYMMAGK
jgi:hypothetical protein